MGKITFTKGKKSRNQLYLPSLRFVAADDWMDKLGYEAFCAWLKFHTWVNRQDENREYDRVPYTLEDTWNKLGVSKSKFYRIIRPLWEYGLIDIIEYEASQRKTQKPKNIIVYESPFNYHETETQPLEKLRDYKKDYDSVSQIHGRKGGRPKKTKGKAPSHGFKIKTVYKLVRYGFKNETVDGFKNETVTVSKMKPNNYTNNLLINTNKSTNDTNLSKYVGSYPHPDFQETVVDQYVRNFKLSNYAKKKLEELVKLYGELLVIESLSRAVQSETDKPIAYMGGVLRKWASAGVTTIEDIKAYEDKHRRSKDKKRKPVSKPKKADKLPESVRKAQEEAAATKAPKMTEEEAERKRAEIRAKLKTMNESLNRWMHQKQNGHS